MLDFFLLKNIKTSLHQEIYSFPDFRAVHSYQRDKVTSSAY